ncbi:MAG: hypothetical protein HC912_07900 [Saprospiraceae bacterium]|nr:hypothetical protein [Saprospiraceae bacterium]
MTSPKLHEEDKNSSKVDFFFNPFPGLRPFRIEESFLFFGREGQTEEVLHKLAAQRFVAVVGPSGSGKSSFIYCGVIPVLHGGFMPNTPFSAWNIIVTRPGGGPIKNLCEALLENDDEYRALSKEDKHIQRIIVNSMLRSSSRGLLEVVRKILFSKTVIPSFWLTNLRSSFDFVKVKLKPTMFRMSRWHLSTS